MGAISRLIPILLASISVASCDEKHDYYKLKKQSPMLCNTIETGATAPFDYYFGYTAEGGKESEVHQWRGPHDRVITFVGESGPRWWFGKLNGKPGTGYNINRRHHDFSTIDRKLQFE